MRRNGLGGASRVNAQLLENSLLTPVLPLHLIHAMEDPLPVLDAFATKKKPMYQEAKLSDLIYKEKRNLYIVRLRDFTKVDSFDEVELSKCK